MPSGNPVVHVYVPLSRPLDKEHEWREESTRVEEAGAHDDVIQGQRPPATVEGLGLSEVNVMITIFCDCCQFSAKKSGMLF
jgi:hypothetical protein